MANRARRSRRHPPAEFTPRQLRFVEEYLKDLNGTQSAIRAGYSARTAAVQASRLLRNAKVARILTERRDRLTEKSEITAGRVLEEMRRLAMSDIRKLFDPETGDLLPPKDWPEEAAAAVAGFAVVTSRIHQTESVDNRPSAVVAKGTPLSVRIRCGRPYS